MCCKRYLTELLKYSCIEFVYNTPHVIIPSTQILEIQRLELEEEEQNEVMIANDSNEASIAEKVAAEQERLNESKRKAAHRSDKKVRSPKGVRSSLKSATANSDRYNNDAAAAGRGSGNYGSSAYDHVKMSQQGSVQGGMGKMKSGEGGKMSSLADDLINRLEASLGSDMRTKATEVPVIQQCSTVKYLP